MDRPIVLRPHLLLLPLALGCVSLPATAATTTASARQLLQDMETACQPPVTGGEESGGSEDNDPPPVTEFPTHGNNDAAIFRAATKSVSVAPDSAFCSELNASLAQIDYTNGNDENARQAARDAFAASLTPDEMPALYTSLVQLSTNQIRNISRHLRGLHQKGQQADSIAARDEMRLYFGGNAGGGNAGDGNDGRFSLFVQGSQVDGSQNQTRNEVGYDLDTDHFTLGADYRISDSLVAGIAFGQSDTRLEYNAANNRTDNDTNHIILYSSWFKDNFAVDALLAHAKGEFDTRRNLQGGSPGTTTALGNTDNQLTYLSLAGSYDFVQGALTWGSFASFDYLDGAIDAFAERDGGGWEVAFAKQDVKSQIYAMGVQGQYAASFGWGVLIPHARAEWRTELEDDRDFIVGRFVQDPTSSFTLTADKPDNNWYQLSAGLSAQFAHGFALFADYEEVLEYQDTDLRTFTAGARMEF